MPINGPSSGDAESELDFKVLVEATVELVREVAFTSADYSLFMMLFAVEFRVAYDALSHHDDVPLAGPNADLVDAIMMSAVKKNRSHTRSCRVLQLTAERFEEIASKLARPRSDLGVPGDTPTNPRRKI